MVEHQYAFGGVSNAGYTIGIEISSWSDPGPQLWRGKAFKMDINTGQLVAEWYSLPEYDYDTLDTELFYRGGSIYPHMSVISDYFVFGTSNLWTYPFRVEECLENDSMIIDNANVYDVCGNDRSDNDLYRCLEEGVYANSIVVLNKHTFETELALPTQGVGAWSQDCYTYGRIYGTQTGDAADLYWWDNEYCPKYNVIPESMTTAFGSLSSTPGMNGDVSSVATYWHDGTPYAAIGGKMGYFWIIDLNEMEVKLSKKVSPWAVAGGSSPFSMAVDPENMIAIFTNRGSPRVFRHKYQIPDGNVGCGPGMVYAIDLVTGRTIWQWVHPFMTMNDDCFWDCYGDGVTDCMLFSHFDWDWGQCEMAMEGQDSLNDSDITVIYPPKNDSGMVWDYLRGYMTGPSTINGDLVFIPTMTGEVYVHSVVDGAYIRTLYCPQYQYEYKDEDNQTQYTPNREGTRSGQTMFGDYLLFYCGAPAVAGYEAAPMGAMVVMRLSSEEATEGGRVSDGKGITWMIVAIVFIVLSVILLILLILSRTRSQNSVTTTQSQLGSHFQAQSRSTEMSKQAGT